MFSQTHYWTRGTPCPPQNLVSSSCLEHLDFLPQGFSDYEAGMAELNVRRFTQLQHEPIQERRSGFIDEFEEFLNYIFLDVLNEQVIIRSLILDNELSASVVAQNYSRLTEIPPLPKINEEKGTFLVGI